MSKYSIFSLVRNAISYHENWAAAWRSPEPKQEYDALIIGRGQPVTATADDQGVVFLLRLRAAPGGGPVFMITDRVANQ